MRATFLLLLATLTSACASVPKVEPLAFAVDSDELDAGVGERELAAALAALQGDPALHLHLVGHADEDNLDDYNLALSRRRAAHVREQLLARDPSLAARIDNQPPRALHRAGHADEDNLDDYNLALSRRRAAHVREQLLARDPSLAARIDIEARGELDGAVAGSDDAAKARNRRVELRFYYPRQCEPSLDAAFLACELARLPAPAPAPAPVPVASDAPPEPPPPPPPPSTRKRFVGAYLTGLVGYGVTSAEFIRQHVRWGVNGGWSWGWNSDFRIALGLGFDHLVDVGFLFPAPDSCDPFCASVDRSALRFTPELRIGGANQVFWSWIRINGGVLVQHRERQLVVENGTTRATAPEQWVPGAVLGIGPGIAFALGEHLFLEFDATASLSLVKRIRGGGTGIFDAGLALGWRF